MRRAAAYLVGGALVAYGCWLLLSTRSLAGMLPVARWLVGGWFAHDLVAAPLAVVAGALLYRYVPVPARAPVQAGSYVSAALTLAATPYVLGHGTDLIPYGRNLAVLLAAVWLCVLVAALVRLLAHRRRLRERR